MSSAGSSGYATVFLKLNAQLANLLFLKRGGSAVAESVYRNVYGSSRQTRTAASTKDQTYRSRIRKGADEWRDEASLREGSD
jgi:hypothetical protein